MPSAHHWRGTRPHNVTSTGQSNAALDPAHTWTETPVREPQCTPPSLRPSMRDLRAQILVYGGMEGVGLVRWIAVQ